MRTSRGLLSLLSAAAALGAVLTFSAPAAAESAALDANKGFHIGIGPQILFPARSGGPFGGGLVLDGRYGFEAGPVVLAPGGRLDGYIQSERFIGAAMPTFRVTLPVGPFAPFVIGGVGFGGLSNPGETGLAFIVGGGLMIHFGHVFAIGAEVTYEEITGTEFKVLAIGPAIQISF